MKNQRLLEKVQGCFLGVAIGDAMGMPVETMKHEQILEATGGKGITRFVNPLTHREWLKDLKAGSTTDDWQLTRAVAVSIIRKHGCFDQIDCAAEHVRELDKSLFGWGKTTQDAIEAIKFGERIVGTHSLPPATSGKGCGNGVIMKVSPLAVISALSGSSRKALWKDVELLGAITHPDPRASITAYAVALFIREALARGISNTDEGLSFLSSLMTSVGGIGEPIESNPVSDKLSLVLHSTHSAESLRKTVGCGFDAIETAAFAIGTFLRHPKDFRKGVLEAVNAGGDTDTNASIVGALIGANCGIEAIPKEWRAFNRGFREALTLAEQICS